MGGGEKKEGEEDGQEEEEEGEERRQWTDWWRNFCGWLVGCVSFNKFRHTDLKVDSTLTLSQQSHGKYSP